MTAFFQQRLNQTKMYRFLNKTLLLINLLIFHAIHRTIINVDYILKMFCEELILIVNFHLVFQQSRTY
jgi:hypothetical protein